MRLAQPFVSSAALASVLLVATASAQQSDAERSPPARVLQLTAPIERWDEALPLGNGLTGGLLWGGGATLKLSLDRGDLWDLRRPEIVERPDWTYARMWELVTAGEHGEVVRLFDEPYEKFPYPTKIPAGRLELEFETEPGIESFALDLDQALARASMHSGSFETFFSATEPVALLRIRGARPRLRLIAPEALKQLGYEPAQHGSELGTRWFLQKCALGLEYAIVASARSDAEATTIALAITTSRDATDTVTLGRQRAAAALEKGFDALLAEHASWWSAFSSTSRVALPDPAIQRQYDFVQYLYGAASRRGAPPIPLQGVWTADEGALPPWKGDFHHDLNTQLTYWPYLAAGHFDEGAAFVDFLWSLVPEHRRFAREFYGAPGIAIPGVMTLDGKALGGWGQYSLSPTNGAWLAQALYLHWRYTMDRTFLEQRAYPYCAGVAACLEALLLPDEHGKLKLRLSTSPEIHDNSPKAWLTPNSHYDLALLRWLFGALAEMAPLAGDAKRAEHWSGVLSHLDDFAVEGEAGALKLSPDESLGESHRHHAHLMALHPLGLIHVEQGERERKIVAASLAQIDRLGTRAWCGYSFSWMACIAARCGESERALANLETFCSAFLSRNGFHLNGDQLGGKHSDFTYRPFTLEGNFAAAQAVHEMLLQSWGGVVRVFPATPAKWSDASFQRLRAEGAFEVSAIRRGGKTRSVRVRAGVDSTLRLRDPFAGAKPTWSREVRALDDFVECDLSAGEVLLGTLAEEQR